VTVTLLSARLVLAGVFFVAAVGKLLDLDGSQRAVSEFGVPASIARPVGVALPIAELAGAIGLLIDPTARYAAVGAFVLLGLFAAALARVLSHGRAPGCHCFGQVSSEPASPASILRNLVLAVVAVYVIVGGGGPSIPTGARHLSATQVLLALGAVIVILLALALAGRAGTSRRLRRALSATARTKSRPTLLPGAAAPEFVLDPVRGDGASLRDLMEAGRPVMLRSSPPPVCRALRCCPP
jgi:uncharacterized membrane protein YphA (DoxX/SURF4 family)